jgi:ATP-binding cassette subfamily G (WHITE) protein 2 (PDR)
MFAFIFFNIFIAILTYYLFRIANLSNLTAKFHKTKSGAKVKGTADKAGERAKKAAQQGAHPGERSGEKDAGTA